MFNKFSDNAKKTLERSPVIAGREKILIDELIREFPDGVTIIAVDMFKSSDGETYYPVLAIKEKPYYFNGGAIALKMVNGWLAMYSGDVEETSAELQKAGGVKVKLGRTKTKNRQTLTTIEIID